MFRCHEMSDMARVVHCQYSGLSDIIHGQEGALLNNQCCKMSDMAEV